MAGDGDHVGHGELRDDLLGAERSREGPLHGRQFVVVVLQPTIGVADPLAIPSLRRDRARRERSGRRVPTAQAVRDVRLVGRRPVAHRGGDQQVTEPAEEGHRRNHHGAGGTGALREVRERVDVRLDLGGHVDVRQAGAQRRLDQRGRGRGERPGAVDHGSRAVQRAVERGRIVDRRRPGLEPRLGLRQRQQLALVATEEQRDVPALAQLRDDEPPGVPVGAEHRHVPIRSHSCSHVLEVIHYVDPLPVGTPEPVSGTTRRIQFPT